MTVREVSLDKFITGNYGTYAKFTAFSRAVPGIDGLKPVHRRVLTALNGCAKGKMISTIAAVGDAIKIHPFGSDSLESSISDMVRLGIIDGDGQFGNRLTEDVPAAAGRYTKVTLTNEKSEYYFGLSGYAPQVEGPEHMEAQYLPIPVPHSLIYGTLCWSVGINSRTPAFTLASLLDAYKHDDYNLLVPNYGYILNKEASDLRGLWEDGYGRLSLEFEVHRKNKNEILIIGSGEQFKPNLKALNPHVEAGRIEIANLDSDTICTQITRVPRARVDMDEVFEQCKFAATKSRSYNINAVVQDKVVTIGIRDWMDVTMALFADAFEQSKNDRIANLTHSRDVMKVLPQVGQRIIEGRPDRDIRNEFELTDEVYESCLRKSIKTLRKKDNSAEVAAIEAKLHEAENFTAEDQLAKMVGNLM